MRIRHELRHGNRRWIVDYRDGKGRRHRKSFAERDKAAEFSRTVTPGPKALRSRPSHTLRDLFNVYLRETTMRRSAATQAVVRSRCRTVTRALESLGFLYAEDQGIAAFNELVAQLRRQKLSEHTIQGYAAAYRTALRWAAERRLVSAQPMTAMRLPEPQKRREAFLSLEEISALLAALEGGALQLPTALGIYQGLRRAEVCHLRVESLEVHANRLTVTASKNRDWRTIQLHPALLPHLRCPLSDCEYLCVDDRGKPWRPDWLGRRFRRALDVLGPRWHSITFHTLRHTCASQMAATGKYTLYQIARFLGHRTIQTTQKYAHLLPDQVKPDW